MLFRILDPQTKANQFWRDFDRLNDELTRSILDSQFGSASNYPPVNVYTKEDEALVTCLLPGIETDHIDINVKDNLLSIHGRKKAEELAEGTEVHRREIYNGEFHRTLELPFRVDQEHVLAKYSNGVLNIHLPRREEDKPKKVSIIAG
ncbi:Hsp20/alpha crystallin family protein [Leptospira sp. 85282-16]|uniref:Hsp20/alpha crystallin family protein n=1 Tax=Leptospira montravelensis TaxID=2484961 RepID=A0ABY2LTT6_9LEPT|nr:MULTISPECIES: Hsp20/alpha crystallin family protein [Leptospira]MCT8332393.1 Hsp20/alpha crystallin family protein [Leptospira sp. 85282-16]TGK83619.1 Hsp20/alpha crystallin family protein [Leptospira montravelensis]TGL05623.1 Hsp20/alpha crystallin family protein [Leptospira montravelensis]